MSSNNNNNKSSDNGQKKSSYDPSRLIFAPRAANATVKRESSGGSASSAGNAATSRTRLTSFRPSVGSSGAGSRRFAPRTASSSAATGASASSGTRRFAPKIAGRGGAMRRRPSANRHQFTDAETHDLLTSSLMDPSDASSSTSSRRGKDRSRGGGRGGARGGRKRRDHVVHVNTSVFGDSHGRKKLQSGEDDVMQVDSSSDEDKKQKTQFQKTPAQLHAEYFEGIANPPMRLMDGEAENGSENLGDALVSGSSSRGGGGEFTHDMGNVLTEDELFFIQLPSHLPMINRTQGKNRPQQKKQQSVDDEYENIWNQEFENSLSHLPEGQIGTMKVYKSGKTKLELSTEGGQKVLLDVTPSADHGFCEDLSAIDLQKKCCFMLGNVTKRITCIPDCGSLLNALHLAEQEELSGAKHNDATTASTQQSSATAPAVAGNP